MKIDTATLRKIIKEAIDMVPARAPAPEHEHILEVDMPDHLGEDISRSTRTQMLDNLRSTAIVKLVSILEEISKEADVMGVNAIDITTVLQDCIQKIQEDEQEPAI